MSVRDWMSPDPVTVTSSTEIGEARRLLRYYGIRHLPVVDADRPVGMISDRDVRINDDALSEVLSGRPDVVHREVGSVMSTPLRKIDPDASVEEAARALLTYHISALPVITEGGALLGVITTTDCLLASLRSPERTFASETSV